MSKTATRPGHETEQALLDAAERLLVEVGAAGITTRRVAEEAGANHGLVHYYFGSVEQLLVRVLERFTERLIERQRQLYAADVAVSREVADGDGVPRGGSSVPEDLVRAAGAGLEPPRAPGAARTGARRVARRPQRGVRSGPRAARARRCRSMRWSRSCSRSTRGSCSSGSRGSRRGTGSSSSGSTPGSSGGRDDRRARAPDCG